MVGDNAYAKYTQFPLYSYDLVKYLLDNNELIWKLIYYDTPDAWNETNLTSNQKGALIYDGQDNITDYRVFFDPGQNNAWTNECCLIRIYPYTLIGNSRTTGTCDIMFDVFSHYKINHMSNYQTRVDTIIQQFIEVFNGIDVGLGIGKLYFDQLATRTDMVRTSGQPPFKGKSLIMSNRLA